MKFTKMHGIGNDYVYVNGFTEKLSPEEKPEIVRSLSDRHFGIGGDGVIFINPAEEADFEMEMYNADGSRSDMCGNGIRCVHHAATLSSIFLSSKRNLLAARLSQGCSKNLAYLFASKEEDFPEEEPPELSSGEEPPDEESPGEEDEEEASLFLSSSS